MKNKYVIGVDTSNYTTSVAILDADGALVANLKRPLPVKAGERGLRQSDAVFAHVKNIPELMTEIKEIVSDGTIVCVGVSEKPRNVEGSYMPCFLVGLALAEGISAASNVPLYKFSHQCGHIMAALYSSGRTNLLGASFGAFHVSGGTTEMLRVFSTPDAFDANVVGGTLDLNAGQVIDRVGVYMGLSFPCGREMEALALQNTKKIPACRPKLNGIGVNLSGLENMAISLYEKTEDKALVSAYVLEFVSVALIMLTEAYIAQYPEREFVYAGGVMSNSIIKRRIGDKFNASFAEPAMSADNAVGVAYLAFRKFKTENI